VEGSCGGATSVLNVLKLKKQLPPPCVNTKNRFEACGYLKSAEPKKSDKSALRRYPQISGGEKSLKQSPQRDLNSTKLGCPSLRARTRGIFLRDEGSQKRKKTIGVTDDKKGLETLMEQQWRDRHGSVIYGASKRKHILVTCKRETQRLGLSWGHSPLQVEENLRNSPGHRPEKTPN